MGRRRGRKTQESTGEALADLVMFAARRWPPVGFAVGAICIALGFYLTLINPKSFYGLGLILGVGAFLGAVVCIGLAIRGLLDGRSPGTDLLSRHANAWTLEGVRSLSWQEFEQLVAEMFRRMGYRVHEQGRAATNGGDGGVDLILSDPKSPGAEFLVQCKQYKAWDVGEPKVREFYGAMAAWRTRCEGIVVTCGRYTTPAQAFAEGKPLKLIDGEGLLRLLNQHNVVTPAVQIATPPVVQAASIPSTQSRMVSTPTSSPTCPKCKATMVRRVAGKGPRRGLAFWGCPHYPSCTACINIDP